MNTQEDFSKMIRDLESGMDVITFLMVKSVALRVDSRQKEYLDMNLGDKTGEINAKKWDVQEGEKPGLSTIKVGDIVKYVDANK